MDEAAIVTHVPFLDLPAAYAELRDELDAAWAAAAGSGAFILGEAVAAFEAEFAAFCGAAHAVGVGSGLEALHLLLRAHGIGPGDEVVVPGHTFIASWLAVSHAGATPVPADVDPATGNLVPELAEQAIGPRTKAILAVHLYGRLAPMADLRVVADRHGVLLLEDAAQAHGARSDQGRAGALGDGAAFSFYPGKNLGALGDGGAVVTGDDAVAERLRLLRNYGSPAKYQHDLVGFNSRLDALQAAALRVKLRRLDEWNARRRAVAERYAAELQGLGPLELPPPGADDHVWHLFCVRHPRRDALQEALARHGVQTISHYPVPVHRTGAYRDTHGDAALPVTDRLAAEVLSLPMGPHLAEDARAAVVAAVRAEAGG